MLTKVLLFACGFLLLPVRVSLAADVTQTAQAAAKLTRLEILQKYKTKLAAAAGAGGMYAVAVGQSVQEFRNKSCQMLEEVEKNCDRISLLEREHESSSVSTEGAKKEKQPPRQLELEALQNDLNRFSELAELVNNFNKHVATVKVLGGTASSVFRGAIIAGCSSFKKVNQCIKKKVKLVGSKHDLHIDTFSDGMLTQFLIVENEHHVRRPKNANRSLDARSESPPETEPKPRQDAVTGENPALRLINNGRLGGRI